MERAYQSIKSEIGCEVKMKVLFCMATGNNAVNINPLAEINPEKVLVLITQSMQESAKTLLDEIKTSGFKAEAIRIDSESSLKSLNEQFSTLIEDNIDDELIANITGGTKLMSMSLYQLFSSWGFRSFYCDKDQSKLIWLDDESTISNIGSKIGLKQYLRVHQAQIKNNLTLASIDKSQKDYANALYQELCSPARYEMICQMIGKIHAHTAQNSLALNNFSFKNDELVIIKELQKTGLFYLDNGIIICDNADNKKFMNGAWLEFLVADRLRGNNCRDIMLSVETIQSTKRMGSETRQEIDVMAMRDDKLIIIECKAKKWDTATQASEAIYKLKALSGLGGLNTLPIFVSLRDIPPSAKTRASEMGIQVITGQADILALKSKLNS